MVGSLKSLLRRFGSDERGVTAVEYGVIAAAIVVGIVVLVYSVGDELVTAFTTLETEMKK